MRVSGRPRPRIPPTRIPVDRAGHPVCTATRRCRSRPIARARLTVDLDAVAANWRALDALSGAGTETAAAVKADAYGLGVARVGPALRAAGARSFFVAIAEEGAELRTVLGPEPAIYVLSGLMHGDAGLCRAAGLVPCLNSPEQIEAHRRLLPGHPCALQIDTGMNRLGIEPGDLARLVPALGDLRPVLALSHLACADEPGHPMNAAQRDAFRDVCALLPPMRRSLAATGGILLGPDYHLDLTRPGVGLYGGLPFAAARPVVTLSLPVVQVRDLAAGETVGYGADWTAEAPARIATVAAGYGDGLKRALARGGVRLFAGGTPCPVVGRVSMDLITVDVTHLATVPDRLEILNETFRESTTSPAPPEPSATRS
jgi:alanine racemase